MGAGVALNAIDHGHEVVGVDPHAPPDLADQGIEVADGLEDLVCGGGRSVRPTRAGR